MNKEVNGFKEIMTGEETKKVMEYAKERREQVKEPIKPWMYTDHPGWSVRDYKP